MLAPSPLLAPSTLRVFGAWRVPAGADGHRWTSAGGHRVAPPHGAPMPVRPE